LGSRTGAQGRRNPEVESEKNFSKNEECKLVVKTNGNGVSWKDREGGTRDLNTFRNESVT